MNIAIKWKSETLSANGVQLWYITINDELNC